MRKTLTLLAGLSLPLTPAFAWTNVNSGPGPKSIADGGPSQAQQAAARATSGSMSSATARGGLARATGQGGSASQSVTVNGSGASGGGSGGGYGGPATALFLPPNPGTSECIKGIGVGATGRESGGLLSYAWHEGTCEAMREGMQFWGIGLKPAAYGRWCQDGTLRKSLGNLCYGDKPAEDPHDQHANEMSPGNPVSMASAPISTEIPSYCDRKKLGREYAWHSECPQPLGER